VLSGDFSGLINVHGVFFLSGEISRYSLRLA
jgi:hypothetical protein